MSSPISVAADVLGGSPVFSGTRVPVQTLLDYLEAGESIDDFLVGFPSVSAGFVPVVPPVLGCKVYEFETTERSGFEKGLDA